MEIVHLETGRPYDIFFADGLAEKTGGWLAEHHAVCRVCVVADSNTGPLYADTVCDSLRAAGFSVLSYTIPAGETSKNPEQLFALLEFLAQNALCRSDLLVALGGGVTGDLTGFAAAIYLRGIDFLQIPTSLLAMVDSSVGGKTAVDLNAGKNLCGAFWQPIGVLIDPLLLHTLPPREYACGMGEIIKYAMLFDPALFALLEADGDQKNLLPVLTACVRHKQKIVRMDEQEHGCRALLNFGHTLGHAVELASHFALSHGEAVAVGMMAVTRGAVKEGLCDQTVAERLAALLQKKNLPLTYSVVRETAAEAMGRDKKRSGDQITLVIPRAIGCCELQKRTIPDAVAFFDRAGAFSGQSNEEKGALPC